MSLSSNADRGMDQLTRLATHRVAAGGGAGSVSRPVPVPRRRKTRAGMEPSRRGPAQEGRVVARPSPHPRPVATLSELNRFRRILASDLLQPFVEAPGVRLLSLGERLEPLRQLVEAFGPRGLGHARVHLRVLVGLAGDRRLEVLLGLCDRLAGSRIADFLQEVEVAEGVTGLGIGGVLEETRDVREPLDVRDAPEIEIPPVRLRLAGERFLQILEALSALEACHCSSFDSWGTI